LKLLILYGKCLNDFTESLLSITLGADDTLLGAVSVLSCRIRIIEVLGFFK